MDERRRFQIALGGIGFSLAIAGAIPLTVPAVDMPPVAMPERTAAFVSMLGAPPLPIAPTPVAPASAARSAAKPLRPARPPAARAVPMSDALAVPAPLQPARVSASYEPAPLRASAPAPVLAAAPGAAAHPVALSAQMTGALDRDHGPLAGAFVVAGKEVGRGFKVAGRAIKSLF